MRAGEFNHHYEVGSHFILSGHPALRGGYPVKTVSEARDFRCGTIVEIDREPFFVKTETLTPAG